MHGPGSSAAAFGLSTGIVFGIVAALIARFGAEWADRLPWSVGDVAGAAVIVMATSLLVRSPA